MGSPVRDRSGRERTRESVEITQRLLWCAAVMVSLIMSGRAGIHRRDKLETGWIGYFCSRA